MEKAYLFCVWMDFVPSYSRHFAAQRSNLLNGKPALPSGDFSFVPSLEMMSVLHIFIRYAL